MNVLESIARTGRNLSFKQAFYGLFLSTLNKKLSEQVPTAGIGKNGINVHLYVNPKFWESLNDLQREGILWHELNVEAQFIVI